MQPSKLFFQPPSVPRYQRRHANTFWAVGWGYVVRLARDAVPLSGLGAPMPIEIFQHLLADAFKPFQHAGPLLERRLRVLGRPL